jgi:hypothetical protein
MSFTTAGFLLIENSATPAADSTAARFSAHQEFGDAGFDRRRIL